MGHNSPFFGTAPPHVIRSDGATSYDLFAFLLRTSQHPVPLNLGYSYDIQYQAIPDYFFPQLRAANPDDSLITVYPNIPSLTYAYDANFNAPNIAPNLNALMNADTTTIFFRDNTLWVKHIAEDVGGDPQMGDANSARSDVLRICHDLLCRDSSDVNFMPPIADFELGPDSRLSLVTTGVTAGPLQHSGLPINFPVYDPTVNAHSFSFTDDGDMNPEYVDLRLDLRRQVWVRQDSMYLVLGNMMAEVRVHDQDSGWFSLGFAPTGPSMLPFSAIPPEDRQKIDAVVLRYFEADIPATVGTSVTPEVYVIGLRYVLNFPLLPTVTGFPRQAAAPEENWWTNLPKDFGKAEGAGEALLAYPNPGKGGIWLELPGGSTKELMVQVFDLQGKRIYASTEAASPGHWKMRLELPRGVYMTTVRTGTSRHVRRVS
ncbi:MAG: T9SS type A sorting domain-containing protein, partial [Bacteroidota bacterium]